MARGGRATGAIGSPDEGFGDEPIIGNDDLDLGGGFADLDDDGEEQP